MPKAMSGWKMYLTGAGLLGLAAYEFSTGDFVHGVGHVLAGAGVLGLRSLVSRIDGILLAAGIDVPGSTPPGSPKP